MSEDNDKSIYNPAMKQGKLKAFGLPIDMSIKKFKKHIAINFPQLTKSERNYLARRYKDRAWEDFHEIVERPSYFPTHQKLGENNGKQATDLPLA